MNRILLVAACIAFAILVFVFVLVRRRRLKERHAAIWLLFGVGTALVLLLPEAVAAVAVALGFQLPANLILVAGIVALAFISIQLSVELGRVRDLTERLATEVALLRMAIGPDTASSDPSIGSSDDH